MEVNTSSGGLVFFYSRNKDGTIQAWREKFPYFWWKSVSDLATAKRMTRRVLENTGRRERLTRLFEHGLQFLPPRDGSEAKRRVSGSQRATRAATR